MKVLITGVEGFVGSYLVDELKKEGYDVVGTYHRQKPELNISLHQMDILDQDKVNSIISQELPDIIYHLAGISNVRWSFDNAEITKNVNVQGTKHLLHAFETSIPANKLIIVSSSEVYGHPDYLPIDEKHNLHPVNPYGESKKEVEELVSLYQKNNLNIIISRSFTHIGPQQQDTFVCSSFAKQIASIELGIQNTIKVGNLEAKRDFTDVRDVVKAYVSLAQHVDSGTYNVCSGESIKINDILQTLISYSNTSITVEQDSSRMRPSDVPEFRGSYEKITSQTGWKPAIPVEQTLKEVLEYWRGELQ